MAIIRFAADSDLEAVNRLRKEVNDLHVEGRPDIFKPGFCDELRDYLYVIRDDPNKDIVVAEQDGVICGFACLQAVRRPETPFMFERCFLDIDEFCVSSAYRRQGIASEMIRFIRQVAKERGFRRLELNMWEFNEDALRFYEAVGFTTYRRYMDMEV